MKIGTINTNTHSFKNRQLQNLGISEQLPNPAEYNDTPSYVKPWERPIKEQDYLNKVESLCFKKDGSLNPLITKYLDDSKFIFEFENEEPTVLTIKDAIESRIIDFRYIDDDLYYASNKKQIKNEDIKNDINIRQVADTKFGPGIYFAVDENDALEKDGIKQKAHCKGKCVMLNGAYYNKINSSSVINGLCDFIGFKPCDYPVAQYNYEICLKILNEYTKNLFVNELGYDLIQGCDGRSSNIVVFNPEAITDISE